MNETQHTMISPKDFVRILAIRWKLWTVPALIVSLGVMVYAFTYRDTWEASQALIVRNEAVNNNRELGKFAQPDDMKTVQETILEIARSRSVIEAALKQVGPSADSKSIENWPTDRDIDTCRNSIKLVPPKGAEFGKTEVFYLNVRNNDRTRAIALNQAIYEQLQARFQQLRDSKANSMVEELNKTVALAKSDLTESTVRLAATEKEVGADLAELRGMQDVGSSDSSLRRNVEEIRNQLREARTTEKANKDLLDVLREAQNDPGRLVATPNQLLESQPGLKRLKDGLIDAQLNTAKLMGTRSADHPLVISARESENEVGRHLHDELALAIRGMDIQIKLNADRQKLLEDQLATVTGRLTRLAEIRATYETQVAENRNRTTLTERAEQNLSEARASAASAKATSLISRIDTPDTGAKPIGPGRTVIALGGILGGLIAGLGVVFLSLPQKSPVIVQTSEPKTAEANTINRIPANEFEKTANTRNGHGTMTIRKALEKINLNSF